MGNKIKNQSENRKNGTKNTGTEITNKPKPQPRKQHHLMRAVKLPVSSQLSGEAKETLFGVYSDGNSSE